MLCLSCWGLRLPGGYNILKPGGANRFDPYHVVWVCILNAFPAQTVVHGRNHPWWDKDSDELDVPCYLQILGFKVRCDASDLAVYDSGVWLGSFKRCRNFKAQIQFKLLQKSSQASKTFFQLLQIERLQLKLTHNLQNSYQVSSQHQVLRHGSNNIQKHKNQKQNENSSPSASKHKLFHLVPIFSVHRGRLLSRKDNCILQIHRINAVGTSVMTRMCMQKRTELDRYTPFGSKLIPT